MFAKSSSTARQAAIGALMNTRMTGRKCAGPLSKNDGAHQYCEGDGG